jgi:hypothetical protein
MPTRSQGVREDARAPPATPNAAEMAVRRSTPHEW